MSQTLYGLVLVGGESRRMGRDKALLSYDKTFISLRKEQDFRAPEQTEALYDCIDEVKGPLCGILSAMGTHPEADWLVVACDLPYLKVETLEKLVESYKETEPQLTAYRSTHDGLPEPLCSIYPSGMDAKLLALANELQKFCPRKLLIVNEARLIDQDDPRSLDNINTAEEFAAVLNQK